MPLLEQVTARLGVHTLDSTAEPYISVVLTTRNDDHGGDPLKRLQAFVNSFDEQCRRTRLDAEVIIVEWNPSPERPAVDTLLKLPDPCFCTYRFIEVPPTIHQRLRYGDVLPLFQMIGKNVGIRRARGRFVLATNIDIIFSNELVEYLASRQLQPGHLYRVDRHDIQSNLPIDAPLETQMDYCASHHLRVHTRWGSYPVDAYGHCVCLSDDIVDGRTVRLGSGWHVREEAKEGRVFRWASDRAELIVEPGAGEFVGPSVLDIDIESNPYDLASWVEIVAVEGDKTLAKTHVTGRTRLRLPIADPMRAHDIELRVVAAHPDLRHQLPIFERRTDIRFRMYSARLDREASLGHATFEYPASGWSSAYENSALTLDTVDHGLLVASDPRKWSYCVRYGPLRARRSGSYRFELNCDVLQGAISIGVLSGGGHYWIPATVNLCHDAASRHFEIVVDVHNGELFFLVISNNHPEGYGVSRFVIHRLYGSVAYSETAVEPSAARRRVYTSRFADRGAVAYAKTASRVRKLRERLSPRRWRESKLADRMARVIVSGLGERLRYWVARATPEFQSLEQTARASDEHLREVAQLRELLELHKFLRDQRPNDLHVNGCGDFQLMARQQWHELRGYPEFEMFSMNIDGLFSFIADAARIEELALAMPIYHLEHEVGSGWSPDGEAILRKRIAERGITWLDASTVYVWASYMRWLRRPMIFNDADWGLATAQLVEHTTTAPCRAGS